MPAPAEARTNGFMTTSIDQVTALAADVRGEVLRLVAAGGPTAASPPPSR